MFEMSADPIAIMLRSLLVYLGLLIGLRIMANENSDR
jgi:hypothetical protein